MGSQRVRQDWKHTHTHPPNGITTLRHSPLIDSPHCHWNLRRTISWQNNLCWPRSYSSSSFPLHREMQEKIVDVHVLCHINYSPRKRLCSVSSPPRPPGRLSRCLTRTLCDLHDPKPISLPCPQHVTLWTSTLCALILPSGLHSLLAF